jgi:hypothetical protein
VIAMPETHQFVEFFGGPLDGHRRERAAGKGGLAAVLTEPISRNTFQIMAGKPARPAAFPTSAAVYELEFKLGLPTYQFVAGLPIRRDPGGPRRSLARYMKSAVARLMGRAAHDSSSKPLERRPSEG